MADFRGIRPRVAIERTFYKRAREGYLLPYLQGVRGRLAFLPPDATTDDWVRVLNDYREEWIRKEEYDAADPLTLDEAFGERVASDALRATKLTNAWVPSIPKLMEAKDELPGSKGRKAKKLFEEFVAQVEKASKTPNQSPEDLADLLERKWKEIFSQKRAEKIVEEIIEVSLKEKDILRGDIDDVMLNYINVVVSKVRRWSRIGKEVYGILKGGEGTQLAKMLTEHLWEVRVTIEKIIGVAKKLQFYMSKEGAVQLAFDIASFYLKKLEPAWDRFLEKAGKVIDEFAELGKAFATGRFDDVLDILFKHAVWFGKTLIQNSKFARMIARYVGQDGFLLLIEDLMQRFSMRMFQKWMTIKRYIDVGAREIDLDALYEDFLKPYVQKIQNEYKKWERRARYIDWRNMEVDLDLIANDLYMYYFKSAWDYWDTLEKGLGSIETRFKQGGWTALINDAIDLAVTKLEEKAVEIAKDQVKMRARKARLAVTEWVDATNKYAHQAFVRDMIRVAQVDVRPALNRGPLKEVLQKSAVDSVGLIRTIPQRFHENLVRKLQEGELKSPLDLAAREKMWRKEGKSAGYNLRRITRDQSNKLTSRLSRAQQQAVGINIYRWETADDDRVRATHVTKDGNVYNWESPPPDTGHPGEDIQCRCIALPVINVSELRARHRRVLGLGKRRRGKGKESDTPALPYIEEVTQEEAAKADTERYDIVPVPGKEGTFGLVPKGTALSTFVKDPEEEIDYGLTEEDLTNDDDMDLSERQSIDGLYKEIMDDVYDAYLSDAVAAGETVEDYVQRRQQLEMESEIEGEIHDTIMDDVYERMSEEEREAYEEIGILPDFYEEMEEEARVGARDAVIEHLKEAMLHDDRQIPRMVANLGKDVVEEARMRAFGQADTARRKKNKAEAEPEKPVAGKGRFSNALSQAPFTQSDIDEYTSNLWKMREAEGDRDKFDQFEAATNRMTEIRKEGRFTKEQLDLMRDRMRFELERDYRRDHITGELKER